MAESLSSKIEYIQSIFGKGDIFGKSENIQVWCPFCKNADPKKKKLAIKLSDFQNHCWVCGWKSKNLLFLLYRLGLKDKAQEHKAIFNVEDSNYYEKKDSTVIEKILELPADFHLLNLDVDINSVDPNIRIPCKYLLGRGITKKRSTQMRFGVCPKSISNHIVIPSFDSNGDLNFYTSRNCSPKAKRRYNNCDVPTSKIIFNEVDIVWKNELLLVEGPFDLAKCELINATCMLGSTVNEEHPIIEKILLNNTPVIVAFDKDANKKAWNLCNLLKQFNIRTKIVIPKFEDDIGNMDKRFVVDYINENKVEYDWDIAMKLKMSTVFD